MTAMDFIEKCASEDERQLMFPVPNGRTPFSSEEITDAFVGYFAAEHKMKIVHWEPTDSAYPNHMLLGGDKGILAYIQFIYVYSPQDFSDELLRTDCAPLLRTIAKADSHLDRPVFFVYIINCSDKSEIRFETNEQIKDRWLNSGLCSAVYSPVYGEMGDVSDLLKIWIDLKKNGVRFY